MKKAVSLVVLASFLVTVLASRSYTYLTIDTNKLLQQLKDDQSITNVRTKPIIESELPNSYLATGQIQTEPPQDPGRRFDIVFFVAIPVTFYLILNIMQLKNMYFFNSSLLDNADWNYIYLNTFFVPLAAAYFDYQYMQKELEYKQEMALNTKGFNDIFSLKLPVLSFKF